MKKERTWNRIGCILGVIVILAGIVFMTTPADSYSTTSVQDASFGADFYTYVYEGVEAASRNAAVTANNIRELGEKLAVYSGFLFIVLGILIEIHFAKLLAAGTAAADARPQPDGFGMEPSSPTPSPQEEGKTL
ncbi:hypothetical protein D1159_07290 [Pseudoflavonifractor sp. 524-17]|uniref:hypothetical protein n=1 Tax=Pseudoflavonifractor sp. 524-17 TaxID=2304577 RepID=UPI00137B312D|nr:hypothetical protein [Pseudoflavonifractor sp. 524-17]NCE64397.1 hypothetical protein [Pseudoflavonifractor sp. 524-17]